MTHPFIPAALAPAALAGLLTLTLVPGTAQAAPDAASSPIATAHRSALPASTADSYGPAGRGKLRDNYTPAAKSHVTLTGDNGGAHHSRSETARTPDKKVTRGGP
ncbi:MAG TPA: hypothetical protein VHV82_18085 [Sporichthyaceae bacterium]|jgi:hypothetical protein|nr:hypothetical protein [Sporichthyaceae bacterium]